MRRGFLRIPNFVNRSHSNLNPPDWNYVETEKNLVSVCCGVPVKDDTDLCWSCNNHTELMEEES